MGRKGAKKKKEKRKGEEVASGEPTERRPELKLSDLGFLSLSPLFGRERGFFFFLVFVTTY